MSAVPCAHCAQNFDYNPSRPNRKYCSASCRSAAEEKRRARTAAEKNDARRKAHESHDVEFIAVDGEGVNRWTTVEVWDDEECNVVMKRKKVHEYVLLSVGDENLYHEDGRALTHHDIFPFLYAQKLAHPKAAFVGFFLGYDFSQWFKSIPEIAGWKMFHKAGIESRMPTENAAMKYPFPVYINGEWEVDILGMKRMKLRPHVRKKDWPPCRTAHKTIDMIEACERGDHAKHPHKWMFICDTGAFFQTSLLQVLNPKKWVDKEGRSTAIVTEAEMSILMTGKGARADAQFDTPAQREEMIRYNLLENDVLARLMKVLNEGFVSDGIHLRNDQWFGPGQAAQAWLRLIGAPTGEQVRDVVPAYAIEAARRSYYGGWFETFIHGPIPGTTYGYDINSAYPYAIKNLPCLIHGTWSHGFGSPGRGALATGHLRLINAHFTGTDEVIGTMPHRNADGAICRPLETQGWHWQHEVDAARRAGMVRRVKTLAWVEYAPGGCDCERPLKAIEDLYESRILVGKETPFGKAKKLTYNSAYGKMAQSVGMPKYSNSVYASLITSMCRTMIIDAIATHPDKTRAVAMIATDGVYFLTPHPTLPTHKDELGKWSTDNHENLSILMPGLYWDDDSRASVHSGESLKLKSRGVSGKYLAPFIDRFDEAWARVRGHITGPIKMLPTDEAPSQEIIVEFSVVSPKLAAARDNWPLCGKVVWDETRLISADPCAKRDMFYLDPQRSELLRTHPLVISSTGELESTPYDRLFGVDPESLTEYRELDDLLIMDGSASDILHAVLPD